MEKLLDLFQRFSRLVSEAFDEDPHFLTARDKAYKQVVNDTQVFKLELPSKTVSTAAAGAGGADGAGGPGGAARKYMVILTFRHVHLFYLVWWWWLVR